MIHTSLQTSCLGSKQPQTNQPQNSSLCFQKSDKMRGKEDTPFCNFLCELVLEYGGHDKFLVELAKRPDQAQAALRGDFLLHVLASPRSSAHANGGKMFVKTGRALSGFVKSALLTSAKRFQVSRFLCIERERDRASLDSSRCGAIAGGRNKAREDKGRNVYHGESARLGLLGGTSGRMACKTRERPACADEC